MAVPQSIEFVSRRIHRGLFERVSPQFDCWLPSESHGCVSDFSGLITAGTEVDRFGYITFVLLLFEVVDFTKVGSLLAVR